MLESSVIGVVVALIFVYSLMAILVTYINDIIVARLNLRAKTLRDGITNLVSDEDLQRRILAHPLIGIIKTPDETVVTAQAVPVPKATDINENITYIDPKTFVTALKSLLIVEAEKLLYGKLQDALETIPNSEAKSFVRELFHKLRLSFTEETFRELLQKVRENESELGTEIRTTLDDLEKFINALRYDNGDMVTIMQGIEQIKTPKMKDTLKSLLNTAKDIKDAEERLAKWFDEGMGRLTAVYLKNIRLVSVVVAAALTIIFNVDTLHIARTLWEDADLRQSVVAVAVDFDRDELEQQAGQPTEQARAVVQQLFDLQVPIGWQWTPITDEMVTQSQVLGLPDPYNNARNGWNSINSPYAGSWIIFKIAGLLVTIIAASQGAPFWFDLLRRATGR